MQDFADAFAQALTLILSGDPDLWEIVALSMRVSLGALALAALIGVPLGAALALGRFPGRGAATTLVNALMGLPPVVVGLVLYLMLSRGGPMGALGLLYTPGAMIAAQTLLVAPIIAALTRALLEGLDAEYGEQLAAFGLTGARALPTLLHEGRAGLATALLAGFGRAIAEVGAVIVVGGNIDHATRVMTTTIALETSKGNLSLALALGTILVLMALGVNALASALAPREGRLSHA